VRKRRGRGREERGKKGGKGSRERLGRKNMTVNNGGETWLSKLKSKR